MTSSNPRWLEWSQRLHSLAQAGLTYSPNPYDLERYQKIQELAAEIIATYSQVEMPVVLDLLQSQSGYATPKVDARGVVFQAGKILLVRELADHGLWTLPGGWVDLLDSPSQAVEREVREEAGFQVRAVKLLALWDRNLHGHPPHPFHIFKVFFLCEMVSKDPLPANIETSEPTFFSEDELPPLSLGRTTPEELHRLFEHLRLPELPTDFD